MTPRSGGAAIVKLFRATADGFQLAAQLTVVSGGRVEFDVLDNAAKHYLADLRDHGVWHSKLRRTVHLVDGAKFLDAVVDSLQTSTYWHAEIVEKVRIRANQPELAQAN